VLTEPAKKNGSHIRRAVVTGIGVLSPIGNDRTSFIKAVQSGVSGIRHIESFDPSSYRTSYGGEVRDFDPKDHLSDAECSMYSDRYIQLAVAAARQTLRDAAMEWSSVLGPGPRAGLVVGTCNGGLLSAQKQYSIFNGRKSAKLDRQGNLLIRYHTLGKALTHSLGITGPSWVVSTACSSSTAALGLAMEVITQDMADIVLVGGADALCQATMAGFDTIKATSTGRIAPFSTPAGLNLGEGAAFWILEDARIATRRNAQILGELLSYAFTADAHHPTAPDPRGEGAVRTMLTAAQRAGIEISSLGCINLHGTGTEANDRIESKAVEKITGDKPVPTYSFKSQVGHCLGAAGILEATAGLLSMREGFIPATINYSEPRPGCRLDYVPNNPRKAKYNRFLSSNYAFGGHNASVVIGDYLSNEPPADGPDPTAQTVIIGAGAITSLGLGAGTLLAALKEQRRGLVPVKNLVDAPTKSCLGGLIPKFNAKDVDRRLDFRQMNSLSRYATAATRLCLEDAGVRVSPKEGKITGVINGVCVGSSEENYMWAFTRSNGAQVDLSSFPSMVANSTGGWVSNALALKGYSCTVAQGIDAGLFALLFGHLAIKSRSASRLMVGAADELYSRYYRNCDELDLLHTGSDEIDYGLRPDIPDRRVIAEGAAYLAIENMVMAKERGAQILATVAGYGQTTDSKEFLKPNNNPDGLIAAMEAAIKSAGWSYNEPGLILWSPQGNSNDNKTLTALKTVCKENAATIPMVTSVFNTGFSEAACGTITLAALMKAWSMGNGLWPQITGDPGIDNRVLPGKPVKTLVLATSELGFNLALALSPFEGADR